MRAHEFITEYKQIITEAVGRDLQHVEDIIYINGPDAAIQVADRLTQLGKNSKELTVKWDGSPAIRFGRDEAGNFHYGDKHAKTPITSSKDIANLVLNREYKGKGDPTVDADRQKFAQNQSRMWKLYEAATPKEFRGYVDGDLMWATTPTLTHNEYVITPNTVSYHVLQTSDLGKIMGSSQSGVALHFYSPTFESNKQPLTPEILNSLGSKEVVILGPKATEEVQANIDAREIKELKQYIKKTKKDVIDFLTPVQGLSNVANVLYTYINSNADQASPEHFLAWATVKLSKMQAEKLDNKNKAGLAAIFNIIALFVRIKVDIINQVESHGLRGLGMRATLPKTGDIGGEGLVDSGSDQPLKFVNRATFSRANRIR
jgi:hypothetical protein